MRIPRNLPPFVMPSDFLSPSYDNISAVATMDIDGPVANKDTEDPSVSHDSSPVATMDDDNAVATKDTNDSSNAHDNSSPMATKDTGDQSVTHGNNSRSTIHGDNHSPVDLEGWYNKFWNSISKYLSNRQLVDDIASIGKIMENSPS